jgi:membrane-bound lytic murein transglycosylase D
MKSNLNWPLNCFLLFFVWQMGFGQQKVDMPQQLWASLAEVSAQNYNVQALPIPVEMSFAGESVPLNHPDVKERLDRELLVNTYWQSNALLIIKRAHKYVPLIDSILIAEGVPVDFKYLAIIESGLQNVTSPAGAAGFWQFMKTTAKEYGLEVNANVEERFNLIKATQVAAAYLKDAKELFGSWTLAAASYNAGRTGIKSQMNKQEVNSYYDLLLNEETSRYVFRILAFKELLENTESYGFRYDQEHLYEAIPTKKVKVDTAVSNFVRFAQDYGINYKILKIHNPWLRQSHLNNASRKVYYIEIPKLGYYDRP